MINEQTTQELMPDTKGVSPHTSDNVLDSVTTRNERPSGGLSLNTPASTVPNTVLMSTVQDPTNFNVDNTWADKYGSVLKSVALKHGQSLFEFTMSIGVANVAIATIMRRIRGNQELTKSMMILASTLDNQARSIIAMSNNLEQFMACKADIESCNPAIMVPEATGRIVVPS